MAVVKNVSLLPKDANQTLIEKSCLCKLYVFYSENEQKHFISFFIELVMLLCIFKVKLSQKLSCERECIVPIIAIAKKVQLFCLKTLLTCNRLVFKFCLSRHQTSRIT